MRRETEHFFQYLLEEDRRHPGALLADYSFLNEKRLAGHYDNFPASMGENAPEGGLPEAPQRKGILGHGSVLLLTSMGTAPHRVLPGEVGDGGAHGAPRPPPPPPSVPAAGRRPMRWMTGMVPPTTREDGWPYFGPTPACASCPHS